MESIAEQIHNGPRANRTGRDPAKATFDVKVWLLECTRSDDDAFATDDAAVAPAVAAAKEPPSMDLGLDEFEKFVESNAEGKKTLCETAKDGFLSKAGADAYDEAAVDAFRAEEFARLDEDREIYLDYVGGSLSPSTLLRKCFESYQSGAAGNPHSAGRKSKRTLEKLRGQVAVFFRYGDDYDMILTSNASAAISMVAECFPFEAGSTFALTKDNHTSVHGIRQSAADRGGRTRYVILGQDLRIWDTSMERAIDSSDPTKANLLAYPAQSNATGVKHDLAWVSRAQAKGFHVLLDAAAYCPTTPMDLSAGATCCPDFIPISFYKIFGERHVASPGGPAF